MRRVLIAAVLAPALGACQPAGLQISDVSDQAVTSAPATADAPSGCNVHVEKIWIEQESPLRRYTSEASTLGPTCQQAVATLIVRAREGSPIFAWAAPTQHIFGLKDAGDPAAMKTALEMWIDQSSAMLKTSSDLPPWEETESQPQRAEFPFMPAEWFDAAGWEALRQERLDLFCFPQGGESLRCAALRDGQMEEIGLQLFPG